MQCHSVYISVTVSIVYAVNINHRIFQLRSIKKNLPGNEATLTHAIIRCIMEACGEQSRYTKLAFGAFLQWFYIAHSTFTMALAQG